MIRFIAVLTATAATGFVLLLPLRALGFGDVRRVTRMALTPARVVMLGDSVIGGYSPCDADKSSIPQMIASALGEPVTDGARPGATLGVSMDALRLAARARAFSVVVVPITVNGGLFRSVRSESDAARLWQDFVNDLTYASPAPVRTVFKGRVYGDYAQYAAEYFTKEKAARACPESAGQDMAFVEYMYWLSYGQALDVDQGAAAFLARIERLEQTGAVGLAVLPPVNVQLMEQVNDPPVMENVRRVIAEAERRLRSANVPVVNLSFALPSAAFADQWCACGHLTEEGRRSYARHVAEAVSGLLRRGPAGPS